MAHECPECGQMCYCNGDVDDCCNNFSKDQMDCQHFRECENELDDEDTLYYEGDDEHPHP